MQTNDLPPMPFKSTSSYRNSNAAQAGFTLVEAVIATAVFVVVIVVVMDLFVLVLKDPNQENDRQELQEQMSYFTTLISNQLQGATIDYAAYDGSSRCGNPLVIGTPVSALCLNSNNAVRLYLGPHPVTGANEMLFLEQEGISQQMVSNDVAISSAEFYIYPTQDPFDVTMMYMCNRLLCLC